MPSTNDRLVEALSHVRQTSTLRPKRTARALALLGQSPTDTARVLQQVFSLDADRALRIATGAFARRPSPTPSQPVPDTGAGDSDRPTSDGPDQPSQPDQPPDSDEREEEPVGPVIISVESKNVIKAMLSIFETGSPQGDYGAVAVLKDGAGISYGLHQATDRGGSLDAIVYRYIDRGGEYSDDLEPFLMRLDTNATALVDPNDLPEWVEDFMALLQAAGRQDPIMQATQEAVFDANYWVPCMEQCTEMALELPLSWGLVYDTCIQSGPAGVGNIRKRFGAYPPGRGGDERTWSAAYCEARFEWLAAYPNPRVATTKYRMAEFRKLIKAGNWELTPPFDFGQKRIEPHHATMGRTNS